MSTDIARSDYPHFERKLRARAATLREEIRDALLRADTEQAAQLAGQVHDAEDEALADLLADLSFAEIERDVDEVRDIDAALRRISSGTYGECIRCRQPIRRERLEAYPTAKRCLPCQQAHEHMHAGSPPPSL